MSVHVRSHSGTRQLFAIGMAILAMLMMGLFQPVGAQADPVTCDYFGNQEDAQDGLDRNPELAPSLDSNGNGIACDEEFEGGHPPEFDFVSCGHYDTQVFAQQALEANPEFAISLDPDGNEIACEGVFDPGDPEIDPFPCGTFKSQEQAQYFLDTYGEQWSMLDPDGNGIACEEEFGTGPSVVVVCNEALGTLVEVSQVALDQYSIDFPFHRATQAEIAAGTCEVTTPETPDVVFCNTDLGTLIEIPKANVDRGDYALDFPNRLATQDEIAAGTCATTTEVPKAPGVVICDLSRGEMLEVSPEMLEGGTRSFPSRLATEAEIASNKCPIAAPAAPGDDEKPATGKPGMVSQLPSTGTGTPEAQGQHAPLVAVPMALILAVLVVQLRNRRSLG